VNPKGSPSRYSLCIWDYNQEENPANVRASALDLQSSFFVVDRAYLASFHLAMGPAPFILLRPVTGPVIRAFLDEFHSRLVSSGKVNSSEPSPWAQRDDVLQCLIHANLKLQQYDQERTNFVARAVHDFRVPLTAALGYVGLLLGERLGPVTPEQHDVLERLQHSMIRLSRSTATMLDLSTRERVRHPMKLEDGDIRETLTQTVHETALAAKEKQITISFEMQHCISPLKYDHAQLEQVFLNLLENAIRFTPRFGTIVIRGYADFWERRARALAPVVPGERRLIMCSDPNCYRIDIEDTGCGIPPDQLGLIFEEYISCSVGQQRSGSGLGLAITKVIVERHRGKIWARTSASGATFSVVLPFPGNFG
jgi:signal transduction histidine kinase